MQAASDIFLGWERATGLDGVERDFYIRQLRDWKGSAPIEHDGARGDGASTPACAAGLLPAPTPAPATASRIAAYLGKSDAFDVAIADFARAYADQNEADHAALAPRLPTVSRKHKHPSRSNPGVEHSAGPPLPDAVASLSREDLMLVWGPVGAAFSLGVPPCGRGVHRGWRRRRCRAGCCRRRRCRLPPGLR